MCSLLRLTLDSSQVDLPEFNVSFKPQKISPKFTSTVRNLLHKHIRDAYIHPTFINDVMKPMQVTIGMADFTASLLLCAGLLFHAAPRSVICVSC